MLNLAHASLYHWEMVGTPRNRAVGEWQLSRIYAELGESRLAASFARASLAMCRKSGLADLVPYAYEAVARAYAIAKDPKGARRYLAKARLELGKLDLDPEDRKIYLGQIASTQHIIDRL
jgi:hypothetical protein